MPAAVRSVPLSSSFGSFLSHSEREARTSPFSESVRVICQYQPDSGSSNSGPPAPRERRAGGPALVPFLGDGGQDEAGDGEDDHHPGGRGEEQPGGKRVAAHGRQFMRRS